MILVWADAATKTLAKKVWPLGLQRPGRRPNKGGLPTVEPACFCSPVHTQGRGCTLLRQLCWKSMLEEPWVTPRRARPRLPPNLQGGSQLWGPLLQPKRHHLLNGCLRRPHGPCPIGAGSEAVVRHRFSAGVCRQSLVRYRWDSFGCFDRLRVKFHGCALKCRARVKCSSLCSNARAS